MLQHEIPRRRDMHIEWLRFEPDSPVTNAVRTQPHVAYRVPSIADAARGMPTLIEPFEPLAGLRVGFYQSADGAVIEFMEFRQIGRSPLRSRDFEPATTDGPPRQSMLKQAIAPVVFSSEIRFFNRSGGVVRLISGLAGEIRPKPAWPLLVNRSYGYPCP